jgi:hypothetical protein
MGAQNLAGASDFESLGDGFFGLAACNGFRHGREEGRELRGKGKYFLQQFRLLEFGPDLRVQGEDTTVQSRGVGFLALVPRTRVKSSVSRRATMGKALSRSWMGLWCSMMRM